MAPRKAKAKKATETNEATKKGRGKAKPVEVEPETEDLELDEKVSAPIEKIKRGQKAAGDSGNGFDNNVKEKSAPPAKRGTKKVKEPEIGEEPESIEDNSGDDGTANAADDESVDTNGDESAKASSIRGYKKQPKKESAKAEPKGRGKKAKPEPAAKPDEDIESVEQLPKAKARRGRKKTPVKYTETTPESDLSLEKNNC